MTTDVYAEYEREEAERAARHYVVTLYYDEYSTLGSRVVWEGQGYWEAQKWAQSAARSLIAGMARATVRLSNDGMTHTAYRPDWSRNGSCDILVGHATVEEVRQPEPEPEPITMLDIEREARRIRRQIVDTQDDISSMRATYVRIGERSGWDDARLEAIDRDIKRFEGKVAALRRALRRPAQDVWAAMEPAENESDEPHPAA